jgi:D-alanine--poly(phosphoribitol) ligase subunit 2
MSEARGDLIRRVTEVFDRDLHLEIPAAELDLFDAGVLDSLAFVTLLLGLEREFGLSVPLDALELEHFASINAIADFVASRTPHDSVPARR